MLATPLGIQIIAALIAAKRARRIRDKQHCKAVVADVAKLEAIFGKSILLGKMAGKIGQCACETVF